VATERSRRLSVRERPISISTPTPSSRDQWAFFARWVGAAVLLLFAGPVAIALIGLAIWFLIPSVQGRGRDLRPLLGPTFGGCAGLTAWTLLSRRSALEDGLFAQMMLMKALVSGSRGPDDDVIAQWLFGVGPLALGIGPGLALAGAWKISRRPTDENVPESVADLALAGAPHPDNGVLLGFMANGRAVTLTSRELSAHMLVAGATQAGKSTLVKRHIEGVRRLGHSVVVVDGKADPGLAAFVRDVDPEARIWIPGNEAAPLHLLGGSPSEFAAKLIDVHRWTEPHYRSINHRYALQLGTYFALSGDPRSPATVVRLLVPDNLDAAADALSTRLRRAGDTAGAEAALAITTYTAELLRDPTRRLVIAGLADRFAGIVEGALASWLNDAPGALRLDTVLATPGVWFLGLPGDTMPDEIAAIGAWLLLELARVAHYRRRAGTLDTQAHIIVEELSAFRHGALHLNQVLARARDAGIAVAVTTQALADVRAVNPTLPDQLLANTGVQVFFHMRDREASWAAAALGTEAAEQETLTEDSEGAFVRRSRRALTAPLVPARVLENFGVGDAILSAAATVTGGERRLERFRVALPGCRRHTSPIASAVLAMSMAAVVAVLVPAIGLLNQNTRGFGHSIQGPVSGITPLKPTRPATVRSPAPAALALPSPAIGLTGTRTPASRVWRVGNTDQSGVYLRAEPDGATLRAWPDNTPMEAAGAAATGRGGEAWQHVRAPDGSTGWVKTRYLLGARTTDTPDAASAGCRG
jgi:hypothetical protein